MARHVGKHWEKLCRSYTEYLVDHAELATSIESWVKTLSYLVAGRISKSHSVVVAELMYSASNLLTLLNDHLLRQHHRLYASQEVGVRNLKLMLSALQAVEVLIEMSAKHFTNSRVKWILIFCVELFKTIGRFILQRKYNEGMTHYPFVKRLNRKTMDRESEQDDVVETTPDTDSYYTLHGSGRRVKSVSSRYRDQSSPDGASARPPPFTEEQMYAESLHNLQPLVHLGAAAWFGEHSWIPWLASLATDVSSLLTLSQKKYRYRRSDNAELMRRRLTLLMYLLRSPCYDNHTKTRLLRVLGGLSRVPGLGYIMTHLIAYLPEWQSTYFYTWTS